MWVFFPFFLVKNPCILVGLVASQYKVYMIQAEPLEGIGSHISKFQIMKCEQQCHVQLRRCILKER